jgi:molecular chaperone DnaJ
MDRTMPRDYYEVLGVSRSASKDEIRGAFRKLARQYHPDVNKAPDAEDRFKEINEAYTVLMDDDKRAAYDRFGYSGVNGMPGGFSGFGGSGFPGFEEIFEEFFGGFGGTGQRRRRRGGATQGRDLRYDLTIEFEQAIFGADLDIEVNRKEECLDCKGSGAAPGTSPRRCPDCNGTGQVRQMRQTFLGSMVNITECSRCHGTGEIVETPCPTCHGQGSIERKRTLTVSVPAGVDDGTQIRLSGEGEPGQRNGPAGDLYVVLHVMPHEFFKRRNSDIILEVSINVAQAALGDMIHIPTVDGDEEVQVPAGTQSGDVFRLKGKGVPDLRGYGHGDALVRVLLETPRKLTAKQRELLEEFARLSGEEVHPISKGFFDKVKEMFG